MTHFSPMTHSPPWGNRLAQSQELPSAIFSYPPPLLYTQVNITNLIYYLRRP